MYDRRQMRLSSLHDASHVAMLRAVHRFDSSAIDTVRSPDNVEACAGGS
jgi:hypothetical protein